MATFPLAELNQTLEVIITQHVSNGVPCKQESEGEEKDVVNRSTWIDDNKTTGIQTLASRSVKCFHGSHKNETTFCLASSS
eukprot:759048-Hanusia_phi.AAC.3